ncbi:hypothetical protein XELAEV_18010699mg [Xenopus laevis]|uniref:THAP-type domain-containing protein n=1 Tax=Xenopus laevis TaxID=8355 RepID=A0A974DWU2_XENLA|nr:hypothetical protein XELAEV_18010699mg [Xenopus laevis]
MAQKVLDGKKSDAFRICSEHFTGDSSTYQGSERILKKDAAPSIFPQSSQPSTSTGSVEQSPVRARKHQKITHHEDIHDITPLSSSSTTSVDLSELGTSLQSSSSTTMEKSLFSVPSTSGVTQLPPFSQDITTVAQQSISFHEAATSRHPKKSISYKNPLLVDTGSHPIYFANTKTIGINTNPKHFSKNRALQTHIPQKHKSIQCEIVNSSQRDSLILDFESGIPNILQSTPIKIPPLEHGIATLFQSTAFDQGDSSEFLNPYNYQLLEETLETTAESIELTGADRLEETYKPSMESLLLMEKEQEETIKDSTIDSQVFHQSKNHNRK